MGKKKCVCVCSLLPFISWKIALRIIMSSWWREGPNVYICDVWSAESNESHETTQVWTDFETPAMMKWSVVTYDEIRTQEQVPVTSTPSIPIVHGPSFIYFLDKLVHHPICLSESSIAAFCLLIQWDANGKQRKNAKFVNPLVSFNTNLPFCLFLRGLQSQYVNVTTWKFVINARVKNWVGRKIMKKKGTSIFIATFSSEMDG